jgi:hypothetical protein
MNCINHPEVSAAAYCRTCGRALCEECKRISQGVVYCQEHAPAAAPAPQPAAPAPVQPASGASASPALAFILGLIPGVGAIYNGQYAKGLVHAVVFGMLVTIQNNAGGTEPLFGILTAAWMFYMAFEAYHTARKRAMGLPVDEFSSLVEFNPRSRSFPVGAVALILLGVVFLLNTLDILRLGQLLRFWPVALIAIGVYMLWVRLAGAPVDPAGEADNVRR